MADLDFYYPFDSVDGDRKTIAATERRFWGALFKDGIVGSGFALTETAPGVYNIGPGLAIIGGVVGGNTTTYSVTAKPATGQTLYIVLRVDTNADIRKVELTTTLNLENDSADQLAQGGIRDLALYSVTGYSGGAYGLLDLRAYSTTFDNTHYLAMFNALMQEFEDENGAILNSLINDFEQAISSAKTENAGLYGAQARQGFLNPAFLVNQRGKDSYGLTSGSSYTYDRWKARVSGRALTAPMIMKTEQDEQRHTLKIDTKPFVSGTGAAKAGILQNIEGGVRAFCRGARSFTVSFDAKASTACILGVDASEIANTGGQVSMIGADTVEVGTTWTRHSLTFTGSTSTAELLKDVLQIGFWFGFSNYERFSVDQDGGHTLWLANIQINKGSSALPCYIRSYADELEACQRYYVALGYVSLACGATLATTNQVITSPLPITRRLYRMPAATFTDRANVTGVASVEVAAGGWRNGLACTISNNSADAPVFVVTNTDAAAVTRVCFNSLALDAEIVD